MRMVLTFTMFAITVIAMLLFIETLRMQFQTNNETHGTFAHLNVSCGGESV